MGGGEEILDLTSARFRARSIAAGVWVTFISCAAGVAYSAATWDRSHRDLLVALFAAGAAGGAVVALLPSERVVRGRWREPFFLSWSVIDLGLIAAAQAADGGMKSPLAVLFFIPLAFAALSYPLPSVIAISAFDVVAYVATSYASGPVDGPYLWMFATALALTGLMCVWQARNHDDQRADVERLSRTDPLTGCLNRRGFEERLRSEIARCTRDGRPLALVLLDLDDFKLVNDTRGHSGGDELLRWTVATAEAALRPGDAIGRLGGDEFALLLPGAVRSEAARVAGRVRAALGSEAPASSGIACFPADGATLADLQHRADAELYAAKDGRAAASSPRRTELSWATALADAVDGRMAGGHPHSSRVAEYAIAIAARLGWRERELSLLRIAAMLHDVGKVTVPDGILRKPGPLTAAEFAEIAAHPAAGAAIVARIEGLEAIVPWIRHSHEHFDGSGYPDGLTGAAIPLGSRILLVAGAYDAMTSVRPYRAPRPGAEALAELARGAGRQFDPQCVRLLRRHLAVRGDGRGDGVPAGAQDEA